MAIIKLHNPVLAENSKFGNLILEGLADDPVVVGVQNAGRIWFNTTEKKLKGTFLDTTGAGLETRILADSTDTTALSSRITNLENQTDGLIGHLSDLTTTHKENLVAAINEVDADLAAEATARANADATLTANKVDKINITAGTIGSAAVIPTINYNAQGQITSVSGNTIQIDLQGVTDLGNTSTNSVTLTDGDTGTTAGLTADFITTSNAVTGGTLTVIGASTLASATLSGGLTVGGSSDFNGSVTLGKTTWDAGVVVDLGGNKVTNAGTPTANTDLTTKGYVDGLLSAGFTIGDGVNTTVISQGDTLVINGTANEVTVEVGADTVTIGLPDNVQITGTLGVTGTTTLAGLTAGATTVTTLGTSGLATLNSASVSTTLSVTGDTTLAGLTAGATSVTTLAASSNATVGGTLGVTGNTTVGGTLGVTGTATFGDIDAATVDTTGNVSVGGTLGVTGATTLAAVTAGDATLASTTVTGTTALQGAATVGTVGTNADLTVNGNVIATGTGTFDGNVVVKGNLTVSGAQTIVETEILKVADNIITLNNGIGDVSPTENAGLEVDRGSSGLMTIVQWNETTDVVEVQQRGALVEVATVNDINDQQAELDATQASAGINADGSFTAFTGTYTTDTTLRAGVATLDTQLARVESGVGAWGTLTTTSKQVVGAINELDAELGNTALTTGATTITAAINEVDGHANNLYTVLGVTTDAATTGFSGLNYVADAATVKAAVTSLDSTVKTRADAINTAAGIAGDAYVANNTANYISTATSLNNADVKLDAALHQLAQDVSGFAGDIGALTTDAKQNIVVAVNEVDAHANNLYTLLGESQDGTTTNFTGANYVNVSTTVHGAIVALDNKVKSRGDNIATAAGLTGDAYAADATTNYLKLATSLMDADKKLDAQLKATTDQVDGNIGNLTSLTTDAKNTLVNAINEVDAHANNLYTVLGTTQDGTSTNFAGANYVASDVTVVAAITTLDSSLKTRADAINTAVGITGDTYLISASNTTADFGAVITGSEGTVNAAITTVANSLVTEKQARKDADASLATDLAAEVTRAKAVEGTLTSLSTTDKTNLVAAINEVDADLASEVSRAQAAETTNANAIVTETTNRTNADSALTTRVNNVNAAVGITSDTYTSNGTATYISTATSLVTADNLLDTALKTTVDNLAATTAGQGTGLVGYKGYTETDVNIVNPAIEIVAGTLESALADIASSVNLKIHELENRYVKGEIDAADASDTYTIAHNLDTNFVDVSVQVYDTDLSVWRFDLVVVEVIDVNTVKISLASGVSAQIRYVIHGY